MEIKEIDTEKMLQKKLAEALAVMIISMIIGVAAGIIGIIIIIKVLGWKVALALVLLFFSNNLSQSFSKKRK